MTGFVVQGHIWNLYFYECMDSKNTVDYLSDILLKK